MTTTALVPSSPLKTTALEAREYSYTDEQIKLIQDTVAPGLTKSEFGLFMYVAKVRNLDPLQRQIHAVKRKQWDAEAKGYVERMTIQTGIDGYRAIANRTGLYMPSDKLPAIEGQGSKDLRVTVWIKKFSVLDKQWHEYGATAYYREFVQTKKSGNDVAPNSMWEKFPLNQLTKCAEALALRKGWPEELGQLYTDDEMPSHTEIVPDIAPKQDKTQREVGKLKSSSEPNRGHGNEGMVQGKPDETMCAECRAIGGHLPFCKYHPSKQAPAAAQAAPETTSETKPAETPTPVSAEAQKPANERMVLKVKTIQERSKEKDGKKQIYLVLGVVDNKNNEWDLYVWDKKLHEQATTLGGKTALVEFSQKESRGRTYCSLEAILEVAGEPPKEEEF